MPRAASNYRQVRLTVTEESKGRVSVRVLVKPVEASWDAKDVVWHHAWTVNDPTPHWLDLLAHAYRALGMEHVRTDE